MYSLANYGAMINDQGRTNAYIKALKQVINDKSVVLEIGTGPGIFTFIASQCGAHHIYAVESSEIIGLARDIAQENGIGEKITFIQGLSTTIELPEQATIIVSDIHGKLPLYSQMLPSIIDARKRHLAPNGIIIPAQESLYVALATAPITYSEHTEPWNDTYEFGIKMESALHKIKNSIWEANKTDLSLVTEPQLWITLDYYKIDKVDVAGEMTWQFTEQAVVHGITVWFDTVLYGNIGFSNQPGNEDHIFGNWFLPLYEPVKLNRGEVVTVKLQADLVDDVYQCRWQTRVYKNGDKDHPEVNFSQSTFESEIFSIAELQKRSGSYTADLNIEGNIQFEILNQMKNGAKLEDITKHLLEKYPGQFRSYNQALARVGEISAKYSK